MGKDDRGLAPRGGILLDDSAAADARDAARRQPAGSPEAGPGIATEGGGAIAEASGGGAEPVTGPGPGSAPERSPAQEPQAAGSSPTATGDSAPPAPPGEPGAHNEPGEQAPVAVRASGVVARPVRATPEPSLAKVLATTIQLWTSRRLRKIGIGLRHPAHPGPGARTGNRPPPAVRAQCGAGGWPPACWRWPSWRSSLCSFPAY